jgi:hypothetical protein
LLESLVGQYPYCLIFQGTAFVTLLIPETVGRSNLDCKEIAFAPVASETGSLQCQAGEVRAVRGGNAHASLFCDFNRRVNEKVPTPPASPEWIRPHSSLSSKGHHVFSPHGRSVKKGVKKGSVVTYFGENVSRFREAFASLGVVKI